MTILSDNPKGAKKDNYSLQNRVGAVLDIVRHASTECPLAIAVTGDWGTGKTSAMRWLQDHLIEWNELKWSDRKSGINAPDSNVPIELVHPRVYPVWFEPWKYSKREDVWRGIIAEVIIACIDIKNVPVEDKVHRLLSAGKRFGSFLGRSFITALSSISYKLGDEKNGGQVEFNASDLKDIVKDFKETAHPEKAYLNEFENTLESWIKSSLKDKEQERDMGEKKSFVQPPQRICIFIDDLDRCLPEVTMEVLKALKLYLNIDQLIFVVGLDREVVDAVVTKHYKEHGVTEVKAQSYLDKMFQVEVDITPGNQKVEDNYTELLKELNESCGNFWDKQITDEHSEIINESLREVAKGNPREVKRLLNGALLRGYAAHNDTSLKEADELDEKLLFTQGVQVFLFQRYMKPTVYYPLLGYDEIWSWLEKLSDKLQDCPDYQPIEKRMDVEVERDETQTDQPERGGKRGIQTDPNRSAEELAVDQWLLNCPAVYHGDKNIRLELPPHQKFLLKLLTIPFKAKVANAIPIKVEASSSSSTAIELSDIHPTILSRIAEEREKEAGDLTLDDLQQCKSLSLMNSEVVDKDLAFIKLTPNLESLDLDGTQVSDVRMLASSASLQILDLNNTQVSDVSELAGNASLQRLFLSNTQVSDVSVLAGSASLQSLNLSNTQVSDVSALAGCASLQRLSLMNTQVSDVSALAGSASLQGLSLINTQVSDVSALANSASLQELYLMNTQVSDVSALAGSASLQHLNLNNTQVSDVSALANSASLQRLYLDNTQVSDVSALADAKKLQTLYLEKGSTLDTSMLKCKVIKL